MHDLTMFFSCTLDLPSESDSDGSGSESEMEPSTLRKGAKRQASDKDDDSIKKENSLRKKPRKREAVVEVDEDKVKIGDKEDSRDDSKDEDDVSSESPSEEKVSSCSSLCFYGLFYISFFDLCVMNTFIIYYSLMNTYFVLASNEENKKRG